MPSNCSLEDICTGACDIVLGPNNAEDVAVSVSVLSSVEGCHESRRQGFNFAVASWNMMSD